MFITAAGAVAVVVVITNAVVQVSLPQAVRCNNPVDVYEA